MVTYCAENHNLNVAALTKNEVMEHQTEAFGGVKSRDKNKSELYRPLTTRRKP